MQGDRRQGAFVVPQTGLHISVGLVDLHGLGCSCQIHSTLSQDHLTEWQKGGERWRQRLWDSLSKTQTINDWSGNPTSHSGMPMKWQAWKADTAWGRAEGSAIPERQMRQEVEATQSASIKKILSLWYNQYIMLRYVLDSCNFVTISLTHILTGKADQPARHIKRVLTPLQHTAQPVESGILIGASHRLM